ncbi:hypothetical protein [Rhodopirellula sp. MGV]|uniref:hypothetical protein n=1 Tax=Rhodopirellula sp. MGV TaxID=2023130 RepID=UPI000B96D2EA|nr:hypothetical protein [Rhodopirellula sp. MGV]OYP35215.1 hypothetical protein CGZ80_12525 [Rhodopirellula sp. MGV]PNY37770.1 hypothetical protein C2E31_05770 [Rhodopirellula baltica]
MEDKLTVGTQARRVRAVGPRARLGGTAQLHSPNANGNGCRSEPEVRVMKQGNRIESIIISCACGEEITVICGYDQPE